MKKLIFRLTILLSALMLFPFQAVEACTGFIVGKNLTARRLYFVWSYRGFGA